jgi:hypothetical protein
MMTFLTCALPSSTPTLASAAVFIRPHMIVRLFERHMRPLR